MRFQRRAASPPIGGAAVGSEFHELVMEDPVDTDAMLAALLQRGERADSAEPSGGRPSGGKPGRGGESMHDAADGTAVRPHADGERRSRSRKDHMWEKRERRDGRSGRHRGEPSTEEVWDPVKGATGKSRAEDRSPDEVKQSHRGDSGSESGSDRRELSPTGRRKRRSHRAEKHKRRSKHKKHKSSKHRNVANGELQEALAYLVDQGVDVSQIVKESHG